METIKISVEVSVNLSENTQSFIKSLFAGAQSTTTQVKPAPATSAKPASTPAPVKPAPTPTPTPAPAKPAPTAQTTKSIEDVRGMLAKKVNEHREEIKNKLNELGAPSVTKLDPSKYDEMYNFLETL